MEQNSWTNNVRNKDVVQRVADERSNIQKIKRRKTKISEPTCSLDSRKLKFYYMCQNCKDQLSADLVAHLG